MNQLTNYLPTDELQRRNAAHHMQPFPAQDELSAQGARVINSAKGVYITDSDGKQYSNAMAGYGAEYRLWVQRISRCGSASDTLIPLL